MRRRPRGRADPGTGRRRRRACARGSERAHLVPTLPGHAPAPSHTGASAAAPIPRDARDTEDPIRAESRRSHRPGPIAAPAPPTGRQADRAVQREGLLSSDTVTYAMTGGNDDSQARALRARVVD